MHCFITMADNEIISPDFNRLIGADDAMCIPTGDDVFYLHHIDMARNGVTEDDIKSGLRDYEPDCYAVTYWDGGDRYSTSGSLDYNPVYVLPTDRGYYVAADSSGFEAFIRY